MIPLLCRDRQPFHKVYRAVQVAEQEFDSNLSPLAYTNVLRACSLDTSKECAKFALRVVEGLAVSCQTKQCGRQPLCVYITRHVQHQMSLKCIEHLYFVFQESGQGAGKKDLNFAALACKNAGMLEDALRLVAVPHCSKPSAVPSG